jgi:UDP-2-acetamido-2,6-beta-L-arabino-hexul-4-ose reductase
MVNVGITGKNGFIGNHLWNTLGLMPERFKRIGFNRSYFDQKSELEQFVSSCDIIVHLAGVNRHENGNELFETNVRLARLLTQACKTTGSSPHIIFSSSIQEEKENQYGKSKKESRIIFERWAQETKGSVTSLIIPNVYGPFGQPFYNSVVATFCYQLNQNQIPKIDIDGLMKLIYIDELILEIVRAFAVYKEKPQLIQSTKIQHSAEMTVSTLLKLLVGFHDTYNKDGSIPRLETSKEVNLFNTFRSFADLNKKFPIKLMCHKDERGVFSEIIRLGVGGQVSFSTTLPGVTRGNHFHTRKIERFTVIKGKALIQLRRVGTKEVYDYFLDGNKPAFVDMPVWFAHNIKNIGDEELLTIFWINEPYDSSNPDTYKEDV